MSKSSSRGNKVAATPVVANIPGLSPDLSLEEMVKHIYVTVNDIKATLNDQQQRVTKLESDVTHLNNEVLTLKNIVNSHEQNLRSNTIRITGFPFTEAEKSSRDTSALKGRVFARIVSPILDVAAARGLIDKPLSCNSVIASCYRIGAPAARADTASPPPLVVKLTSPQLRVDLLRCKKEAKVGPNDVEKALGIRRFNISEDLTQPAFKKLKELQNCSDIDRAWSVDGKLNFTVSGSSTVHRVSSVFDDIELILSKVK